MASWPLFHLFATLSFIFLIYRSSPLQTFKLHNKQDLEQQYSIVDSHLSITLLVTCSPSSVSTASYFEHTWYGPAEYCLEDEKGRERQRPMTLKSSPQSRLSDAYMLMMMINWNRAFVFCNGIVRPLSRTPIKENIYIYIKKEKKKKKKRFRNGERYLHNTYSISHERRQRLYSRLLGTSISFSRSIPVKSSATHGPFSSSVELWKASARRID
jgi:hypothetical protein